MEQGVTAQQILSGVWRRKKVVAAVAAAALAIGLVALASMPNVYQAMTVVRVEPDRPSPDLVTPSVTQLIEDRLKTVRVELLSRPIIRRTVEDLDLYPRLRAKQGVEAAVDELRHHLDVKVEGENAFELSVDGPDPKSVAQVANRLPELFAEEALRVRDDQATEAQELFGDELAKLSSEVAAQEAKINAFKMAHLGELPEQLEANMRGLERLTALLGEKSEALREAQRRQADFLKSRYDAGSEAGRLAHREGEVYQTLLTARSQWTEDHPEVQRLERELASVHDRRIAAEQQAAASDISRATANAQVAQLKGESAQIQHQAEVYKQHIDDTARWTLPLAELDGQHDILKTKYQQMLSRKVEADVAHDLELKARSQMFHVLSPAVAPRAPVRPDRFAGMILVGLLALGLGVLAGVTLELYDDSVREPGEAEALLRLPVLAAVPEMGKGGEPRALHPRRAGNYQD